MTERVSPRSFIGTVGTAAVDPSAVKLTPPRPRHGREGALRDTAHLHESPS